MDDIYTMLTTTLQKQDGPLLRETSSPAKKENRLKENLLINKIKKKT